MDTKTHNITIALAGIFQSSAMVKQWAYQGQLDETAFLASMESLLDLNPTNMAAIYHDLHQLKIGIKALVDFFTKDPSHRDKEVAGYFVGLVVLQRKLNKHPEMLKQIHDRIPFVSTQIKHFGLNHPTVIANIADIYTSTLSQLKYLIHGKGNRAYLEQEEGLNKIRALLLAGVRAAILWNQVGGRLYQLFLFRKRYKNAALELLNQIEATT